MRGARRMCAHRYDFATVHPAAQGVGFNADTFMAGSIASERLLFWGDVAAVRFHCHTSNHARVMSFRVTHAPAKALVPLQGSFFRCDGCGKRNRAAR